MDSEKAEFKRLMELMGWSQTEAARRLRKTPSAINHLVNPAHSNKPTPTMMQLLKLIITSERPDLISPQPSESKETNSGKKPKFANLGARERLMIEMFMQLPQDEQDKIYSIIIAWFKAMKGNRGKTK